MATAVCKKCYEKGIYRIFKKSSNKSGIKGSKRSREHVCPECKSELLHNRFKCKEEWLVHEEKLNDEKRDVA